MSIHDMRDSEHMELLYSVWFSHFDMMFRDLIEVAKDISEDLIRGGGFWSNNAEIDFFNSKDIRICGFTNEIFLSDDVCKSKKLVNHIIKNARPLLSRKETMLDGVMCFAIPNIVTELIKNGANYDIIESFLMNRSYGRVYFEIFGKHWFVNYDVEE